MNGGGLERKFPAAFASVLTSYRPSVPWAGVPPQASCPCPWARPSGLVRSSFQTSVDLFRAQRAPDGGCGAAEHARDLAVSVPFGLELTDLRVLFFAQQRNEPTTLLDHVLSVVLMGSQEQMRGVAAELVVAPVAHDQAFGDVRIQDHPDHTMREQADVTTTDRETLGAVPGRVASSGPVPAGARVLGDDLRPQVADLTVG